MEQAIVGLFTEIRRHKPSVIYIPNVEVWYATLAGTVAFVAFHTALRSIPPTDPVLVLGTADCDKHELPDGLLNEFFGFSHKNKMEITRPERVSLATCCLFALMLGCALTRLFSFFLCL